MSVSKPDNVVDYVETTTEQGNGTAVMGASQQVKDFQARQQSMTRKESIKEHWKPLAWCMFMFYTCIMFGFDSLAGGVVVSIFEFRRDFGHPFAGDYVIDANWQLAFQAATLFGRISRYLLRKKCTDNDDRYHLWWFLDWFWCQQMGSSTLHTDRIHYQHWYEIPWQHQ